MKFTTRELFLLTLMVALALGWWVDRSIYVARANMRAEFAAIRHWQATTLWNWAKESDFVKSIESDDHSTTITTKNAVAVFAVPSHLLPNPPVDAP